MIETRLAVAEDAPFLKKWLLAPNILQWFPMCDEREIDDSIRIWMSYIKMDACFTAVVNQEVAGMSILYLQPYKKFSHQCLFAIIVAEQFRGQGVGTELLNYMMKEAKEKKQIELLHLEVYEGNPAYRLYERLGFVEYGRQPHFIKWEGKYFAKILMQKRL
jgi:putative acetyltransferase